MSDCPSTKTAIHPGLDNGVGYPGGKGVPGLASWICSRFPSHVYYAEPFAGKGAIYRAKTPCLRSFLIDSDCFTVDWWKRRSAAGLDESDVGGSRRHRRRGYMEVFHGCGIRFCELAAEWGPSDLLVYCDPPYLLETRSKKRIYRNEMSDSDHLRLLNAITAISGPVLISGYWSELYASKLSKWKCAKRFVMTRGGVKRKECLWSNPAAARASSGVSMEYSDLGTDWRERDRVSKKVRRWVANYSKLHSRERRANMLALLDAENANAGPNRRKR